MNPNKGITAFIRYRIQHFNPRKYWKRYFIVTNPKSHYPKLLRLLYLYYIKKCDAFNCASLGCNIGGGPVFSDIPNFPHGLNGIIIHPKSVIGKNVTIHQQVTLGYRYKYNYAPVIGDNVFIGAGAKILGKIHVGNNVRIGANAVVVSDVPDNCTVVGVPARIIRR